MDITNLVSGIQYKIKNKNDIIQNTLLNGVQWNEEIIEFIKTQIKEKNLKHFLNVGSHIGSVCLPISLHIEKVSAIEAYPPTYLHLCENIILNNLKNVYPYNIAVGNTTENAYFMSENSVCPIENINRIANNSGGMHVFSKNDIENKTRSSGLTDKKITGTIDKLDNLDIDLFDIMLVDIEGYEYEFLLGSKTKITKNKPIIIIEIWNDGKRRMENMNTTQSFIIQLICSFGYELVNNMGEDFIFFPR